MTFVRICQDCGIALFVSAAVLMLTALAGFPGFAVAAAVCAVLCAVAFTAGMVAARRIERK